MLAIIVAALAAWIFGAAWYGLVARRWMAASGLTEETIRRSDPLPYLVSLLSALVVASMTAHIMWSGAVHGAASGLVTGLGLGAFIALPWLATNVMFGQRDRSLIWLDGGYVVGGSAIIGLVLGLWPS